MKFVIIDSRSGGTHLDEETTAAMEDAKWVFIVEQDGHVRCLPGEKANHTKPPKVGFFTSHTEEELSAIKARKEAQAQDKRKAEKDVTDRDEALKRATAVWQDAST